MHGGSDIDCADFHDGGLQVDHRHLVDAVIDSQRAPCGVAGPALAWPHERWFAAGVERIGPMFFAAHAMLMPALQRTATARAVIVLARPFVVMLGQFVEHAGADRCHRFFGLVLEVAAPEQIVGHTSQAESGASALVALVQHQAGFHIAGQELFQFLVSGEARGQRAQRCTIGEITEIEPVGPGIKTLQGVYVDALNCSGGLGLVARGHLRTP